MKKFSFRLTCSALMIFSTFSLPDSARPTLLSFCDSLFRHARPVRSYDYLSSLKSHGIDYKNIEFGVFTNYVNHGLVIISRYQGNEVGKMSLQPQPLVKSFLFDMHINSGFKGKGFEKLFPVLAAKVAFEKYRGDLYTNFLDADAQILWEQMVKDGWAQPRLRYDGYRFDKNVAAKKFGDLYAFFLNRTVEADWYNYSRFHGFHYMSNP